MSANKIVLLMSVRSSSGYYTCQRSLANADRHHSGIVIDTRLPFTLPAKIVHRDTHLNENTIERGGPTLRNSSARALGIHDLGRIEGKGKTRLVILGGDHQRVATRDREQLPPLTQ